MNAKFTKGPWFRADDLMDLWRAEKRSPIKFYTTTGPIVDINGKQIASISQRRLLEFDGDEDEEQHANERLTVTAPDFYEHYWQLDHVLSQQAHITIHRGGMMHAELKKLLLKVEGKA